MKMFYLVLALLFSLMVALLAIVNNEVVEVNYIFGKADVSLIILILGSASAGAMGMGMFALFSGIRRTIKQKEEKQCVNELKKRLEELEEEKKSREENNHQEEKTAAPADSTDYPDSTDNE